MSQQSKPLVQVACVCEKVLTEPDNVSSLIRIVDTYHLTVPEGKKFEDGVVELTAYIALKSGDVTGEHTVGLRLVPPDGGETQTHRWPVVFDGGEHGATLKIAFVLPHPRSGLYWFDVLWGEEVLTKIPVRLKILGALEPSDALSQERTSQPS